MNTFMRKKHFVAIALVVSFGFCPIFATPITITGSVNIGSVLIVTTPTTKFALPNINQNNYNTADTSGLLAFLVQSNNPANVAIAITSVTGDGSFTAGDLVIDNVPWTVTYKDCNDNSYTYTTTSIQIPGTLNCSDSKAAGFFFDRPDLSAAPPQRGDFTATISINVSQK